MACFDQFNFYVGLADLKMILVDFWTLADIWTFFQDTELYMSNCKPCIM